MFLQNRKTLPQKRAAEKEEQMRAAILDATNLASSAAASIAEVAQLAATLEARVTALEAAAKSSK